MRVVGMVVFWAVSLTIYFIVDGVMNGIFRWGFDGLMKAGFLIGAGVTAYQGHRALFGLPAGRGTAARRAAAGVVGVAAVIGFSVFTHTQEAARQQDLLRQQGEAAADHQARMARESADRIAAARAALETAREPERGTAARIVHAEGASDTVLWIPNGRSGFENGGVLAPGSSVMLLREVIDGNGTRHAVVRTTLGREGWVPVERVQRAANAPAPLQ